MRARTSHEMRIAWLFTVPTLVVIGVLGVFPCLYSLWVSLHEWPLTMPHLREFIGLRNYVTVLGDARFWSALKTTLSFTVTVVAIQSVLGLILALLTQRQSTGMQILRSIFLIPMMLAPVVVGLMWKYMYNADNGIMGYLLHKVLGCSPPVWLGSVSWALPAVMAVDVWQRTPFIFLSLVSGLTSIPLEVFDAVQVDGASTMQTVWYVILPLLKPFILVSVMFRFIDAFRIFDIVYVMTTGGPANVTESLTIYAYKVGFNWFHMGYAVTLAYMILAIILVVTQVFLRSEKDSA